MGKAPCCDKKGLKKGPWTSEEDQKLIHHIRKHGQGRWRTVPKNAGLKRCGKSCRLRWTNYLRPDIKRGRFSFEEEETIIQLHSIMGNKWSSIAARLPGRTDNEIKNYWNTHIRRRLLRMGIDPVTHTSRLDPLELPLIFSPSLYDSSAQSPNGAHLAVNPNLLTVTTAVSSSDQYTNMQFFPDFHENPNPHAQNQLLTQENHPHITSNFLNVDQFSPNTTNFSCQNPMPSLCTYDVNQSFNIGYCSVTRPQYCNQSLSKFLPENHVFMSNKSNNLPITFGFGTVMSTPLSSSTPLNLSTMYVNSSTEDERESYCSNVMLEFPNSLDVDGFM